MPIAGTAAPRRRTGIPDATVARLPVYLRVLTALAASGTATVSSDALASSAGVGFATRGFRIAALVDADPRLVGERVNDMAIRHLDDLETVLGEEDIAIGVIATPGGAAQAVCDRLVAAGVTSVLNFAPSVLTVPD